MPALSIIIPAYNEADRIVATLEQTWDYVLQEELDCEIIVVDDGSSDATASLCKAFGERATAASFCLLEQKINQGKGAAVRRGMLESCGAVRLFMDADLATPLTEIQNLLPYIESAPVVIASRALESSNLAVKQPPHRQLMGTVFRTLVRIARLKGIRDSQCGFKLFTASAAQAVFSRLTEPGFVFDVEALAIAQAMGYQIAEVGVTWRDSGRSAVNPLRDPLAMFIALFRIRSKIGRLKI